MVYAAQEIMKYAACTSVFHFKVVMSSLGYKEDFMEVQTFTYCWSIFAEES